jgi:hypothetical protein
VQLQLDVYGEIADAMFQARTHGLPPVDRWSAIGRALLDLRWPRSFEQKFRVVKWIVGRG